MNQIRLFLHISLAPKTIGIALRVSLVVGTILNVFNQGQAVLDGGAISWFQLVTNYLVPYCVATYSAAKNEMSGSGASVNGRRNPL